MFDDEKVNKGWIGEKVNKGWKYERMKGWRYERLPTLLPYL